MWQKNKQKYYIPLLRNQNTYIHNLPSSLATEMPCSPVIDYWEVEGSNPCMCAQKWNPNIMVPAAFRGHYFKTLINFQSTHINTKQRKITPKHKCAIASGCEVEMVLYAARGIKWIGHTFSASLKLSNCSLDGCKKSTSQQWLDVWRSYNNYLCKG